MASINEKELTRIIKSGEISGAYYIYGTDLYSIVKYKKAMVKKIVAAGDEAYNLHEFQGRDADIEGICEVCETYPMFADKICVTICDLDMDEETKQRPGHKKLSDTSIKMLNEAISNLPDTTVLIFFTASSDIYGGKKFPTPKNKKLIDFVSKNGTVCEIAVKSRNEVIRTISSHISKQGSSIDDNAAGLVFDRCSGDMNLMMNEADKLASYANGKNIDIKAVEMLTPDSSDAKSYSLADAVAAGNMSKAMQIYSELISDPENTPIYLLYVLTGSMNDLYRARTALDSNHGINDVMRDFGYARNLEFRVKNAFSSVRKTSAEHLRKCMEILACADIAMKSGAGDPAVVLETSIVKMLAKED